MKKYKITEYMYNGNKTFTIYKRVFIFCWEHYGCYSNLDSARQRIKELNAGEKEIL